MEALEVGLEKLREYYGKTDDPDVGDIYAHSTILDPRSKLQFFQKKEWTGGYDKQYLVSLQDRIKGYQSDDTSTKRPQALGELSELDMMFEFEAECYQEQDELTRYLQGSKLHFHLIFFHLN